MTFFADEGLDFPLVKLLREKDYQVTYAAEDYAGAIDGQILQMAQEAGCILITKDKDFGALILQQQRLTAGIILVRIEKLNRPENCQLVVPLIDKYVAELPNSFTVIQEDKIRIRTL